MTAKKNKAGKVFHSAQNLSSWSLYSKKYTILGKTYFPLPLPQQYKTAWNSAYLASWKFFLAEYSQPTEMLC